MGLRKQMAGRREQMMSLTSGGDDRESLGPSSSSRGARVLVWLLGAVVLLAWFSALGGRALLPSDEGRYAQIAREMLVTGDWITVRYNGLKYFEKPPFHLWMSALAFDGFGVGAWQARLWSALSGLLGIAAMMLAAARWWGRRLALLTALVMLAMPLWTLGAQFNSLDMSVSAALAWVLAGFLLAHHPQASVGTRRRWMLVAWAAMGVAVLTKGLMGVVLPGLVLTVYTVWTRDWRLWLRLHWVSGLAVFLLVTVPWFWLVSARNPEFAHFFFIHEHFQRYTSTIHRRDNPWWFFIPLIIAGLLPWTGLWWSMIKRVLAAAGAGGAPGIQAERLLAVWAVSIFLFFSASGSKLPGYILPVFPALALLAARALAGISQRSWRACLWGALLLALVLAALAPLVGRLGSAATPQQFFQAYALWLVSAALIAAAGAVIALMLERFGRRLASIGVYSLACLLATLVGVVGHDTVGRIASGVELVPAVRRVLQPDMPLYGVRRLDHTLPFYLQHRLTMVETPDELEFGTRQEPDRWIPTLAQFADRWQHGPRALAIMSLAQFGELRSENLPMIEIARDARRVVVANFEPSAP